jgi:predicted kinase
MAKLTVLVGPPGSGKSTLAKKEYPNHTYINQDSQGKSHLDIFNQAILDGRDIVIDRMGFNKQQRQRYLEPAKKHVYHTEIIVLHQPRQVCLERCIARKNHETIKDEQSAQSALNTFFGKYERPTSDEADVIDFRYPEGLKQKVIWSDLDGTLCDVEHRRHFVRQEGKKDWNGFFKEMVNDKVNWPVMTVLKHLSGVFKVVYCTGRPDNWKKETLRWLENNNAPNGDLFMRPRNDSRQDDIIKEIILDFEVLTRYSVYFCLDDRDQVVKMLRKRGQTVFQVAEGDF